MIIKSKIFVVRIFFGGEGVVEREREGERRGYGWREREIKTFAMNFGVFLKTKRESKKYCSSPTPLPGSLKKKKATCVFTFLYSYVYDQVLNSVSEIWFFLFFQVHVIQTRALRIRAPVAMMDHAQSLSMKVNRAQSPPLTTEYV